MGVITAHDGGERQKINGPHNSPTARGIALMHAMHNARVNLAATALNNMALAFVVAGFIAPTVNGQLPAGGSYAVTLAWIVLGAGLHFIAQLALGSIRT